MDNVDFLIKKVQKKLNKTSYQLLHGECLIFALNLQEELSSSKIIYLPEYYHFVIKFENKLYDVSGNVTKRYKNSKAINYVDFCKRTKQVKMYRNA